MRSLLAMGLERFRGHVCWWISSLLFGLQPAEALTLAFAIALMLVVGVFATYIPARRALRVDPMVALRYE